jgi:hypothetical protein
MPTTVRIGGVRLIRAASKDHRCYECGAAICKGSSFAYHTLFGFRSARNFRICYDCQSVIWRFFGDGWWFGSVWNDLYNYLEENWQDDLPSSCIVKLTPAARDKVCDILELFQQGE